MILDFQDGGDVCRFFADFTFTEVAFDTLPADDVLAAAVHLGHHGVFFQLVEARKAFVVVEREGDGRHCRKRDVERERGVKGLIVRDGEDEIWVELGFFRFGCIEVLCRI